MLKKEIYLAGGCFWGMEAYFNQIEGVLTTQVGYANGKTHTTNYQIVKETDHAETLHLIYDSHILSLTTLLQHYFRVIDPFSVNRQGGDIGRQYRTGIYCTSLDQLHQVEQYCKKLEEKEKRPLAVERAILQNFVLAEDYHQKYLEKNPGGYCHIDLSLAKTPLH